MKDRVNIDIGAIEAIKPILERWLSKRGLELNQQKTKIINIKDGFNYLILMVIMSTISIERWEKVKNNASPDDPELSTYWNKRQTKQGKTHWTKGSKLYRVAPRQSLLARQGGLPRRGCIKDGTAQYVRTTCSTENNYILIIE